ncbi:alpha/beta hydrolase [Anoxybacillus gonensis]|uniref:Alpha/beta fold hydrolase n=1 Tax=Anoxybacillus gonensis TaxID=198467 RepID=A0AAW7THK0_9BACL|nr:alpha/beta fold hydrolase [Anoxybacillus gonensis]AKS38515.1 alpha/beta hydrolase [Anoxybacillus gonensis]KGP59771.1 alpha/beta hydrolase [Anoxybacillus gonensis]MCX8047215.1 alpha/beta fold hydrolase [Anoxybacillus gonensis]MDO0878273.1 alpha/beta fold hydrolase [Anoxybacillus gonensis]
MQIQVERQRNTKKWLVPSLISVLLLAAVACVAISIYVGWNLTHKERKAVVETPKDYGMAYQDVTFTSKDEGLKLKGWVIEPTKQAKMTVIFSHGYGGNRYEPNVPFFPIAKALMDEGYRVIMFDFRASGESEGEMTTIGAKEKYDLLGVIDYAKKHYSEPIVLYGVSMGAATSILAASMDEDVQAVIADSAFSDLEGYLRTYMPVWTNLPNVPFTYLIITLIPMITDLDPAESVPIQAVDAIAPRPILFIHSKADPSIPHEESVKMYNKHPDVFELWLTDKAKHVKSFAMYKDEYIQHMLTFLEKVKE